MNQSPEIKDLAAALAKAQGSLKPAKENSVNPHFKSSYADLSSVWEACREALTANQIAVVQSPEFQAGHQGIVMVTRLLHSSGEWLENSLFIPVSKNDAQGVGSAISYGRRYALAAMVGVAVGDDDGNQASTDPPKPTTKTSQPAPRENQPRENRVSQNQISSDEAQNATLEPQATNSEFLEYDHMNVSEEDLFSEAKVKRLFAIGAKLFSLKGNDLETRLLEAASKICQVQIQDLNALHWRDGNLIMQKLEETAVSKGVWESKAKA